ncbi:MULTISPECIES: S-4TM family putative pore-forming effector [unclassified Acinetobacter]|uniref:S-4TM family putative pore-forming effector n=1 Tax=unclassified Acinetobacter TaxID=196816 RepID=UPI0015D28CB6
MSNILHKQNLDENLRFLAAQRQINSDLKAKRSIVRLFSILIFAISVLVLNNSIQADDTYSVIRELFCIGVAIVSYFLIWGFESDRESASKFQKKFDSNLFDLNYDITTQDEIKASKYAEKHNSKVGNLEKIEGWYTSAIGNKAFPEDIISCQKQNLMWTRELKKHYVIFLSILNFLILGGSLFIVFSFWSDGFYSKQKMIYEIIIFYLCYMSAFLMPLIKHILDLYKLNRCIFLFCELKDLVGMSFAKKMNIALISKIQNCIDDYRKSNLSVPDFFAEGRKYVLEAKSKIWVKD